MRERNLQRNTDIQTETERGGEGILRFKGSALFSC